MTAGDDPILVWGAGAMGGSVGAWLRRAGHEVRLVDADANHVSAIREHGLRITGPVDEFTVEIPASLPDEVEGTYATILLAVKAHHTDEAVRQLAPHLSPDGCVVSLQNGLNERAIAAAVGGERTVGCFINVGADVVEPGVIMRGNHGALVLGELDGSDTPRLHRLLELFRIYEPGAEIADDIFAYLWGKLAYGALLFATALADASIADVLASEPHRPLLVALVREVVGVAEARGIRPRGFDGFDPSAFALTAPAGAVAATLDELVTFNRRSAKSHSGVWRDLAVRERKTEVDAQLGPIVERGGEAAVPTPLTTRLVELVHDIEEGRRSQSWETLSALGTRETP